MGKKHAGANLAPRLIAVAVASCFASAPAWGNPTGAQVVNGTAAFARPNASTLRVTSSPGAIINWQGFSIGAGEITRFIQQSSSSAVLNRVVGADISSIQGQLLSNGRVFLINPSGIVVGPGAVIDTAGFVGSTLAMQDADFLAGKLKFQGDASSGRIVNQGWIRTGQGGQVMLVAPQIENSGLIHTPKGELILAAGRKLTISSLDHEGVQFEVQAPTDSVMNVGRLLAEGGTIGVFAGTLRHSGEIRATSLALDATGQIVLSAQKDVELAAGSITSASGAAGGKIVVQSGDTTLASGSIEAKGSEGKGGTVHILGDKVGLLDRARVDASGHTGGGTILAGGDYKGENPGIRNASATFVGADTTLRADATAEGRGGRIILWSDEATRAYGTISARGANGGKGGFVETSSKGYLEITRGPDVGAGGTWLLDPLDIEVVAGNATNNNTGVPDFTPTNTNSQVGADLIVGRLNLNANVTLDTNVAGADLGNITINSPIIATPTGSPILTLNANNLINIAQPISITTASVPAGQVRLIAGNGITQALAAPITANMLLANGGTGSVQMGQATNMVNELAGNAADQFTFKNGRSLTIGTVGGVDGITVDNPTSGGVAEITISTTGASSDLHVNRNITALSGANGSSGSATISLTAQRNLNVTGSTIFARSRDVGIFGDFVGPATVTLTSNTGNITVTNSTLQALGGNTDTNSGGAANVTLSAASGININSSTITATGGSGNTGTGGAATVNLTTTAGGISINNTSTVSATGGNGENSGGAATVSLTANAGNILLDSGTIIATAGGGPPSPTVGGNASVTLQAGSIAVNNSSTITATGGDGSATAGTATVNLQGASAGNAIAVNSSTISATGGSASGAATVTLQAASGGITVNNSTVTAAGGIASDASGGAATVQLLAQTSLGISNGSMITANGGLGFDGGNATVTLQGLTGGISINSSSVAANGGDASGGGGGFALVTLAGAGITLNSSTITATGGNGSGSVGPSATVSLTATNGGDVNFTGGSDITVTGGAATTVDGAATIDVIAEEGAILQSGLGVLQVASPNNNASRAIDLQARDGIGGTGSPIRVASGFTSLNANNASLWSPGSGNVVLSQTTGDVDLSLYTVTNDATNGGVDIKAEVGSIIVPGPGFSNPNGPITFRADSMDIQGPLTALLGTGSISLQTVTAARPIQLGTIGDAVAALALSDAELANLSAGSLTIGSIANAVSVTDAVTLSQSLSLPGGVTVTGLGSLDIGGATNTVGSLAGTGGIVLSGGALAVGSDNTSTIFSGVIGGTGGLTKQGTGRLTLSGANTYAGATTVSAGVLRVANDAGLGSSASGTTVAAGAALEIAGNGLAIGESLTLNGSGVGGAGALRNLAGANAVTGPIALGSAARIRSGAGVLTLSGDIDNGGFLLTVGGAGDTLISGVVNGSGALAKQNAGTLTLSGANTYTGATTVNAGMLALNGGAAIADTGAVNLSGSGAGLTLGANETIGSLTGVAGSTVALGSHTLTVGNALDTTFDGVIGGAGGLTKQGTGTLTLAGANTYTGTTAVNAGTLSLDASGVFADGSTLAVNGGTLDIGAFNDTVGGVQLISGTIAGSGGVLTSLSAYDMRAGTVSANLGGAVGLNKTTAGTLTLSGSNSYTGTTTVSAGTLATLGGAAIADGSAVMMDGGILSLITDETIGSLAGTSNVALGTNTLTVGANNNSTSYSGVIGGTGGLTKAGAGTLTLSGANTYAGATTVKVGTLVLDGATLSGSLVNESTTRVNGSVLVGGGVQHSGTLNLQSGGSLTVGGSGFEWQAGTLAGRGGLAMSGGAPFRVTGGATHTLNGPTITLADLDLTGGSLNLRAGTLNVSDTITVGSGTTLASQGATINAPTLDLSGTFQSGAGSVTVGSMNVLAGGLLKGTGTLNADVNNVAGIVSPGLSPGILTISGDYVQGAAGTLNMDLGGTVPGASGHDQLIVTGTATLGGTLNASLISGFIPSATDSFTLVKAGSVSGTFATANLPAGTFLAPTYLVSSFVLVSSPPPSVITFPPLPPIVVVETEKQRKTLEEAPEKPAKDGPTSPICR